MRKELVTFLSDFGIIDETVACCKGAILSCGANIVIVDITHMIPPYSIVEGGWSLAGAVSSFPPCVHMAVVDPGVGGSRDGVVIEAKRGDILVGPDNGLLMEAARRLGGISLAWLLDERFTREGEISPTFHGRDIFSPVAARLAMGLAPSEIGSPHDVKRLMSYPVPAPQLRSSGIAGGIVVVDNFGTLRSNIPWQWLRQSSSPYMVEVGSERAIEAGRARTFSDVPPGQFVLLSDSWGFLSLAVNQGNASKITGAGPGQGILVKWS